MWWSKNKMTTYLLFGWALLLSIQWTERIPVSVSLTGGLKGPPSHTWYAVSKIGHLRCALRLLKISRKTEMPWHLDFARCFGVLEWHWCHTTQTQNHWSERINVLTKELLTNQLVKPTSLFLCTDNILLKPSYPWERWVYPWLDSGWPDHNQTCLHKTCSS